MSVFIGSGHLRSGLPRGAGRDCDYDLLRQARVQLLLLAQPSLSPSQGTGPRLSSREPAGVTRGGKLMKLCDGVSDAERGVSEGRARGEPGRQGSGRETDEAGRRGQRGGRLADNTLSRRQRQGKPGLAPNQVATAGVLGWTARLHRISPPLQI